MLVRAVGLVAITGSLVKSRLMMLPAGGTWRSCAEGVNGRVGVLGSKSTMSIAVDSTSMALLVIGELGNGGK